MEEKKNIQPHNEVNDEELDAVTGGAGAITGFLPTEVDQPQRTGGNGQSDDSFPKDIQQPQ